MLEDSHLLNPYLFCLFLSVVKRVLKSLNRNWGFLVLHSFLFCSMYFQALLLVRAHSGICVILMNGLLLSSWNFPLYLCPQASFRMLIRPMQLSCNYCCLCFFFQCFSLKSLVSMYLQYVSCRKHMVSYFIYAFIFKGVLL